MGPWEALWKYTKSPPPSSAAAATTAEDDADDDASMLCLKVCNTAAGAHFRDAGRATGGPPTAAVTPPSRRALHTADDRVGWTRGLLLGMRADEAEEEEEEEEEEEGSWRSWESRRR